MIDELIEEKIINEEVVAQVGYSTYKPENYKTFEFMPENKMSKMMNGADTLITHSGVGSITIALELQKKVIVVPRLKKFGEHVDDHQLEIAEAYYQKQYIALANSKNELKNILTNFDQLELKQYIPEKSTILSSIQEYIASID